MPSHREEILLVQQVITHPAGFNLDVFGDCIAIQGNDQGTFEVTWTPVPDPAIPTTSIRRGTRPVLPYRSFTNSLRAAAFFVWKRHKLEYGVDCEAKACRGAGI
jgi:hypothetical protein